MNMLIISFMKFIVLVEILCELHVLNVCMLYDMLEK